MKKYVMIGLCLINSLNCMEQPLLEHKPQREPREWDAYAYENGNDFQTTAFLYFLDQNKITIENRTIFDFGCGTGKLSAEIAKKATHVHGTDASKNMIDFAINKYGHIKNLSFEHCFAEDFQSLNLRQLAVASFCVHWIEDKKCAFQRIHDSLAPNGEFFANVRTSDNLPLEIIVATEMMPYITQTISFLTNKTALELSGSSYPSRNELFIMLKETGFDILKLEEQSYYHEISEDELRILQWPIISSRPVIKHLPEPLQKYLFKDFIDRYLNKLQQTDNGKFLDTYSAVIIHARKKKK